MAKWALALCLVLLLGTALAKRGGSSRRNSKSKSSSSSSSSSVPANSYPKQQWAPAKGQGTPESKKPSAPPGYPGNQNPSYPPYSNNNAPPAYSAPGHPYPAPPAYSAPGHHYPSPPGYPGHGYPQHGVPNIPMSPGHIKGPKMSKSGIGTNVAAGVAGVVAGAALAKSHNKLKGPKIRIGGGYYDGYSSSEEYFDPYVTGPYAHHRHPHRELTEEEKQLWKLARLIERLCDKLRQPSVCTLLRTYGLHPFSDIFNATGDYPANLTALHDNSLLLNGTMHFNTTMVPQENKLVPIPLNPGDTDTSIAAQNEGSSEKPSHLTEDQLKAADNLFKALE